MLRLQRRLNRGPAKAWSVSYKPDPAWIRDRVF